MEKQITVQQISVPVTTKQWGDFNLRHYNFKSGRKLLAQITRPNPFNGYKWRANLACHKGQAISGDYDTFEDAKQVVIKYLHNVL